MITGGCGQRYPHRWARVPIRSSAAAESTPRTSRRSTSAVTVNLTTGQQTGGDAHGDTLTTIENLTGVRTQRHAHRQYRRQRSRRRSGQRHARGRRRRRYADRRSGTDTASYAAAAAGIVASLAEPSVNTGDAAGDTYITIENLTGSGFADVLTGDAGANALNGGAGTIC